MAGAVNLNRGSRKAFGSPIVRVITSWKLDRCNLKERMQNILGVHEILDGEGRKESRWVSVPLIPESGFPDLPQGMEMQMNLSKLGSFTFTSQTFAPRDQGSKFSEVQKLREILDEAQEKKTSGIEILLTFGLSSNMCTNQFKSSVCDSGIRDREF